MQTSYKILEIRRLVSDNFIQKLSRGIVDLNRGTFGAILAQSYVIMIEQFMNKIASSANVTAISKIWNYDSLTHSLTDRGNC